VETEKQQASETPPCKLIFKKVKINFSYSKTKLPIHFTNTMTDKGKEVAPAENEASSEEKEKLTYTSPVVEDEHVGPKDPEKKASRKRKATPPPPVTQEDHNKIWVSNHAPALKRFRHNKKKNQDNEKKNVPTKKGGSPKVDVQNLCNLKKAGYITKSCQILKLYEFLGKDVVVIDKLATFNNGSTYKVRTQAALDHLHVFNDAEGDGPPEAGGISEIELEAIKEKYGKRWWTVSRTFAQRIKRVLKDHESANKVASPVVEVNSEGVEIGKVSPGHGGIYMPEVLKGELLVESRTITDKKKLPTKWVLPDGWSVSLCGYSANEHLHPTSPAKPLFDDISGRPFLFLTPQLELIIEK
jgi:hypothetical protein